MRCERILLLHVCFRGSSRGRNGELHPKAERDEAARALESKGAKETHLLGRGWSWGRFLQGALFLCDGPGRKGEGLEAGLGPRRQVEGGAE